MKRSVPLILNALTVFAGISIAAAQSGTNSAPSANDALINALIKKGVLTESEAAGIKAEVSGAPAPEMAPISALKWNLPAGISNVTLFGDARLRYEYRSASNPNSLQQNGVQPVSPMERFRYALRLGIKGDAYDDFSYGIRLETSSNPRSPWVTFGSDNTSGTLSGKAKAGIYVGQLFIDWHPAKWMEITVGKMSMPLYTTPMVWDSDISPEGAFEKVNADIGPVNAFIDFGQFDYQDPSSSSFIPSGDVFVLAWQAGATWTIEKNLFAKIAPVVYTYTGAGVANTNNLNSPQSLLYGPFTGEPDPANLTGGNDVSIYSAKYNQYGINNLTVLEIPAEFDFPIRNTIVGNLQGRLFGDFAYNLDGANRAKMAAAAAGLSQVYSHEIKAYQVGMGIGSEGPTNGTVYGPTQGVVYGNFSRKNAWEGRVYWQHVEQYALDVNLLDSDFFEGRGNMEGIFAAFAYGFSDAIIGTVRYGYADRINKSLGTGGNNLDMPALNPVENYHLFQLDLSIRF